MGSQDRYDIDFEAASRAYNDLDCIKNELAAAIKTINQVESDMLSDANWKGPNKSTFQQEFNQYQEAIIKLFDSCEEHCVTLKKIVNEYAAAEQ